MNCGIREWKESDASSLASVLSNKKILENLRDGVPYPYTEQDALNYIQAMKNSDKNDVFVFAVVADDKVVGNVGADRQENVHRRTAELGYYLGEEYWGRGIMTEAVKKTCAYIFEHSDIIRIFAETYADNVGSCRVLEKAGFTCEGVLRKAAEKSGVIKDVKMYALIKE